MTTQIKLNGQFIDVLNSEITVIQECERHNVYIPRFCYHDRLSIAGNCRMCLVELENAAKPVIACSTSLSSSLSIHTNSQVVRQIRESVLEFLLINHPLDCPICDQGGECDLQDQSMVFGSDRGRFVEFKRSVEDKNFGPFIKTIMTRCIHCTRCIRFFEEIAGMPVLGTMGRGRETEVGTYTNFSFYSEISGNVIDLCPVGALTSKPYAFSARPWELTSIESIDVFDSLGSNIRVDVKGNTIMRVLPKLNESVNEEWISDKIRFGYDGLKRDRLTYPMLRLKNENHFSVPLRYCSWDTIYLLMHSLVNTSYYHQIKLYAGELNDLYAVFMLKYWLNRSLSFIQIFYDSFKENNLTSDFLIKDRIQSLSYYDTYFLYNIDLKSELSILNTRLQKNKWKHSNRVSIYYIGPYVSYTYKVTQLGISEKSLVDVIKGKHFICSSLLKRDLCVLENRSKHLFEFLSAFTSLSLNKVSLLSSEIHYHYLGLKNSFNYQYDYIKKLSESPSKTLYYLYNYNKPLQIPNDNSTQIIYHGHHGTFNAMLADIIIPSNAYMEEQSLFMNLEGKIQVSEKVIYGALSTQPSSQLFYDFTSKPYYTDRMNFDYFNDLFSLFIPFQNHMIQEQFKINGNGRYSTFFQESNQMLVSCKEKNIITFNSLNLSSAQFKINHESKYKNY